MGLAIGAEQMGKAGLLGSAGQARDKKNVYAPDGRYGSVMPVEGVLGTGVMPGVFAQAGMAYAAEHDGVGFEQFAKIAEKNHAHSSLNPLAQYQKVFSLEEVMGSPMQAYPNTLLMCCPTGDGAAAMFTEALNIWKGLAARDAEARAYTTLGDMAHARHDYEMARTYLTAALASWRSLGDDAAVARILNLTGWAAAMQGDLARARTMLEEALAVAARVGDEGQRSATLHSLGEVARLEGNLAEARSLFEESLDLAQASGWRTVLWWPVHSLGALARTEGNLTEARERLQEAVALCPKLARRPRLSDCLEDFASVVFDEGDPARAAVLLGAADALRTAAATPVPPAMRASFDDLVRDVRAALGGDAFEQQWTAGMSLTADAAVELALESP